MRGVLAVILGLVIATPASAAFITGNDLQTRCSASDDEPAGYQKQASCSWFVMGVIDTIRAQEGDYVCVPEKATSGQVGDIVKAYLNNHPEKRHLSAWSLVVTAVSEAFCK